SGSGAVLERAWAINDHGQIIAYGLPNGSTSVHTYRLDPVLTFPQTISQITVVLASFGLNRGESNALTATLDAALAAWNRGDTHTARNQMNAFENKVNAQTGQNLTAVQASY